MAGALKKIAAFLGEETDQAGFAEQEQAIQRNIDDLHWSQEDRAYCDASIEREKHVKVCHKGYISLFPFLVGLLGTRNPRLDAVLDLICDEDELWSPYGLRSLSRKSPLYGSGENYWRSPVWVNINYMAIERLLVSTMLLTPTQFHSLILNSMLTFPKSLYASSVPPDTFQPQTYIYQKNSLHTRNSLNPPAPTKKKLTRHTPRSVARSSQQSTTRGAPPASPGSSITLKQVWASVRSISLAGPLLWSRSWHFLILKQHRIGRESVAVTGRGLRLTNGNSSWREWESWFSRSFSEGSWEDLREWWRGGIHDCCGDRIIRQYLILEFAYKWLHSYPGRNEKRALSIVSRRA
jgi:hypothetical protein